MTLPIGSIRGRLISAGFARTELPDLHGVADPPPAVVRALDAWSERLQASLGPASGVRAITDVAVVPLLRLLGFEIGRRIDGPGATRLEALASEIGIPVLVIPWEAPLDRAWRDSVLGGVRVDSRWSFCCNGTALRIVDARHTWTRRHLEFDLTLLPGDEAARRLWWSALRADAMAGRPPFLDRAAERSARHGLEVCAALGAGVLEALGALFEALSGRRTAHEPEVLLQQSLTVLYRVLFLLFAEARGLVPVWHPVYRERYSIDGLVSGLLAGGRSRGIWHAVLAISRLAHAGCAVGELKVTAFNGRLFSPVHSAAFDRAPIADEVMRQTLMAVATTVGRTGGRTRIDYRDLDVEQLGAVYERVLEHEPARRRGAVLIRTREVRRSTGTFYTPRSVTAFLVRHALAPLVRGRTADEILRLRVLDPAMGSGAFLVAACRYLAAAAEERLIEESRWHRADVTQADRASLRREIAQRCLFGVDLNPTAVQLARLSIWLATLASDRPLTFLDHHLVVGDSLVGASVTDVLRQPTRVGRNWHRPGPLPLFPELDVAATLQQAVRVRHRLALEPDTSPGVVLGKERALAALHAPGSPLARWASVLDLWCAGWYSEGDVAASAPIFAELCSRLFGRRSTLADSIASPLLERGAAAAARHRFFHWTLAFPEVFNNEDGEPLESPGFDALVGNPPWDMVRGDSGDAERRAVHRTEARHFNAFVRGAGIYRVARRGHANRYQLFVERALQLLRPGGRLGLVLPSGLVGDAGAAPLRRRLFEHAAVDTVVGLDNRRGIFPIHRSLRFVLVTGTAGSPTTHVASRFGVVSTDGLEAEHPPAVVISRKLLERLSGPDDLGIPELRTTRDLRIVEDISARVPWLGADAGWAVRFGRELNATDDRHLFRPAGGDRDARPVLEGKQIEPFRVTTAGCRYELGGGQPSVRVPRRARLAFRDVASATNRLTLIAAVVPASAVTTHTLSCLRTPLPIDAQHVLGALLNSFVANYLIRLRVNTHVPVSLVARLPVPVVRAGSAAFSVLAHLSNTLATSTLPIEEMPEYVDLQARVFDLYGLRTADAEHVLGTFPLVPDQVKGRILDTMRLTSGATEARSGGDK